MKLHDSLYPTIASASGADDLRKEFLISGLFRPDTADFHYWGTDRTVLGGILPFSKEVSLPNPTELRSAYFLERREAGVLNLGGPGLVRVDGTAHRMESFDALYLGRGAKEVVFASQNPANPARFWLLSYPAHMAYPTRHVPFKGVEGARLGQRESANERTIYKLIHPGAFPTCQLVMGLTRLEPGSVWNTMPPHTHLRRSEIYLYFNLPADQVVFHFMGRPQETRHLVVRDCEAVLSPPWSIHSGVGTSSYSFIWGMGGENQEFTDMDPAPLPELR